MVGGSFERYLQIGRGRSKASLEAQMPVDSNFQFVRGHAMNCVSVLGIGDVDLFPGAFGGSCPNRWARCSRGVRAGRKSGVVAYRFEHLVCNLSELIQIRLSPDCKSRTN